MVLTAGIDVQDNRIEVEILSTGLDYETWSIDYKVLVGAPSLSTVWDQVDALLEKRYRHESGLDLKILRVCIDSGFQKQLFERFCNPREIRGVYSVKGVALVSLSKKKQKGVTSLVLVEVDTAKEDLYSRLKIDTKGPGYCHFPIPQAYNEEYFK